MFTPWPNRRAVVSFGSAPHEAVDRPMDIAVTGSSGLIGSRLVAALEAAATGAPASFAARAPADLRRSARGIRRPGPSTPPRSRASMPSSTSPAKASAEKRWTADQKERIRTSRTGAPLCSPAHARRLWTARRSGCCRVRRSAIYGDTGDRPIDESGPRVSGFLPDVCVEWEAAAARRPSTPASRPPSSAPASCSRTEGGALAKQLPFFRAGLGGRSGTVGSTRAGSPSTTRSPRSPGCSTSDVSGRST